MAGEQQGRAVTLDELVAQLDAIRSQANNLRSLLDSLTEERGSVVRSKDGLDAIARSSQGSVVLFPLSDNYEVLVEAIPQNKDKVLVHLGADVYAKLDVSEGLKILSEREGELNKAIGEVSQRLAQLESLEAQYESVIQQALASAQRAKGAQG
ncbi:prefoldin subunit alpha [Acidilobus sp. 7A]|jgi:prefoldin alpha subunit|uniref:prefoldin subunit alpha n=1 Tax=Acidilobus sp. 7A TaxID=1577685 RepID=UPI001B3B70BA|nr:prefoldin subunit alpha [Acidilobus sp. 7A]